jgi:hypothetical protein
MIEPRQLAALLAIAAGGVLNAGMGAQVDAFAAPAPSPLAARAIAEPATPAAVADPMQQAARNALLAQLRADLGDPEASLQLAPLNFTRGSGRSLEGRGTALATFDGSEPVRLEVSVSWDEPTQRIEQASWLVSGPTPQRLALDADTRHRIADRIGSRLVLEFAGQPVDFSLRRVEHLAAGRDRLLVAGEGVADFGSEGAARTRFVATAERASGKLLTLQYELGEQLAPEAFKRN